MKKRTALLALAAGAALAAASAASAQVTINLGTLTVPQPVTAINISTLIPAGTYTSYTFTTDWSAIAGDPWSNEAFWALNNTGWPTGGGNIFFVNPGPAGNSAANGSSVTLTWSGSLTNPITTNGSDPVFFLYQQSFAGSSATWANATLTLIPTPATVTLLGLGGLMAARRRRA